MSKFKVGDWVRRTRDVHMGMRAGDISTVTRLTEYDHVHLAHFEGIHDDRALELHGKTSSPSPIRAVTRREIVPGVYGHVEVSNNPDAGLMFFLPLNNYNAEELREAAHLFNQLAEVLEENQ